MEKPTRVEATARRRVRPFLPPLSICALVFWAFYPLGGNLTQQQPSREYNQDLQNVFRWSDVKSYSILELPHRLTSTRSNPQHLWNSTHALANLSVHG